MPRMQDVWFFVRRAALVVVVLCGTTATASAQTHYEGAAGPGSLYEIDVPANWNGDLVLYAHGIVEAALPVRLPTTQDGYNILRSHLLAAGYAVAASSYSSNGWALADAVRRTHQLNKIVARKAGRPRRTFLVGHSMGALAIVKLAEQHPEEYDGVLAMCGPLGGALAELQYAGDARVTFDYYFPNVLPGTAFDVPPGTQYLSPFDAGGPNALFLSVYSALSANPIGDIPVGDRGEVAVHHRDRTGKRGALRRRIPRAIHQRLHRARQREDAVRQRGCRLSGQRDARSRDECVSERASERRRRAIQG